MAIIKMNSALFSLALLNGVITLIWVATIICINVGRPPTTTTPPAAKPSDIIITARSLANTTFPNSTAPTDDLTSKPRPVSCGEANILLAGIPPYHPLVTTSGFDPDFISQLLSNDTALLVSSGYNVRMLLFGPEQPLSLLQEQMADIDCWHGTGVGFGERGTTDEELTIRFEDTMDFFRKTVPRGPIMFNSSPTTFLPALQRHFPIEGGVDCEREGRPGKLLGFRVFCDESVCKKAGSR
ncbi:hypothetical protein QBC40DRAFT_260593 [Triangularia verruculosa]|uniref:Uncharacterized protein n=1 Tax=Triangularia verruculosa TaxID=2587418 RepID=A0AAN6XRQ8_9PEZI|nr:hypothetical protein QBC40DRAFT_260593 [Triangularia verruculosa]